MTASLHVPELRERLARAGREITSRAKRLTAVSLDLIREARDHRYFQSFDEIDWSEYQLQPILIASVLINLLELSSPLYINIVYTSILPSGSMSSLIVLTAAVVVLMLLGGWLKSVRLALTGTDGARVEHHKRLDAVSHFLHLGLPDFLRFAPGHHLQRLTSINLLRDESALQSLTTAIDLAFSVLFILVLFLIGGTIGLVAVLAIAVYLLRAIAFARDYEALSRRRDRIELTTRTYQDRLVEASELIKSNGLRDQLLVANERYQEEQAHERLIHNSFAGSYQAFGSLMSQVTFATGVTWGAVLVVNGWLSVGALAASILLLGKILSPWQQAMGLWNSYRRLAHSRDEYDALMALPVESSGGDEQLQGWSALNITLAGRTVVSVERGASMLLKDNQFGLDARQLFLELIQINPNPQLQLNGVPMEAFQRTQLRNDVAYVDPARSFFDGTLLENLTGFQPSRHRRGALFWSYLCGLDQQVRSLPQGYATAMGGIVSSGLSRDAQALAQVVTALSRHPQVLLLDLTDCSYGKTFVDALERILRRCRGATTVLIGGGGLVMARLVDQQLDLQAALKEAN